MHLSQCVDTVSRSFLPIVSIQRMVHVHVHIPPFPRLLQASRTGPYSSVDDDADHHNAIACPNIPLPPTNSRNRLCSNGLGFVVPLSANPAPAACLAPSTAMVSTPSSSPSAPPAIILLLFRLLSLSLSSSTSLISNSLIHASLFSRLLFSSNSPLYVFLFSRSSFQ